MSDWAIHVTDDTIEVAEGVTVHPNGERGGYFVVRGGVIEGELQGASPNLAGLMDSVASGPLPSGTTWAEMPLLVLKESR